MRPTAAVNIFIFNILDGPQKLIEVFRRFSSGREENTVDSMSDIEITHVEDLKLIIKHVPVGNLQEYSTFEIPMEGDVCATSVHYWIA
jgi:hypothetical protein